MLRPLLLLGAFLLIANTFGQTLIPDANFEQFLVDQGIDTNGITGDILNADAAAVTNLNVTRNDITDFTGLEAFVNVITLDLGQNNFLTAPMTTLTLLEELVFDDNDILDNLDLTQNVNLRILNIGTTGSGTNASTITDLDLSQNMVLETIYVYAFLNLANLTFPQTATITQIDVIGIEEDVFDFTNHSGLVDLGLNQNTSTTSILLPADKTNLMFLDIRNMGVNNIDLDGYNALERVSLRGTSVETLNLPTSGTLTYLFISGHRLPSVYDLSSVPNIVDLTIESNQLATSFNVNITALADLVNLDLQNNKMTTLDITQNTILEDVNMSNNQLPTFDLSQNTLLTDLNASSNLITTLDLSQNVALEELNLTSNELPTLDVSTNILLENLLLGFNELPTLDVTNNPELFRLNISDNLFTTTGLDLTQNPRLDNLNASNNQIESLNISQNPRMGTLLLSNNLFTGTSIIDQYHTIWSNQGALGASDRLDVSFNQLSGQIPDFASLIVDRRTNYFEFQFNDNNFEFGDFEDQHAALVSALTDTWSSSPFLPFWRDYDYAPQAKVNAIENPVRNAGESITLTTTVRGAQNHYRWFKDGVEIPDAPDAPELVLENLNTCDAGVYYTEITSDLVPFENANPPGTNGKNLLLVRNDITLTVNATKTCATLDMPLTNVPINTGIQWDDNPGACGYRISLGTASGSDDLLPLTDVGEVTVYNHPTDFATNQDIFVTIIPYYDDGDFACTEQSFRTNASSTIPDCTILLSPTDGNTNVAVDLARITWNPANGADEYNVTVSSPSGANDITTTVTDNFLDFTNDFTGGETVTVSIVPANTLGNATGCTPESFTIVAATAMPPNCTNLVGSLDGATDVAVDLAQISWDAVTNADGYRLTLNGSSSDTNDETNLVVTGTSHAFTNEFDNGETVTVTIVPFNADGDATGCTPESFTIIAASPMPPGCTNLAAPMDGDTDIAVDLTQIAWNLALGATGYRLTIDSGISNANEVTDLVVTGTSHPLTDNFVNGETVTVTIVPFNADGSAIGCSPLSFTIVSDSSMPPNCTNLNGPLDGATDVAIDLAQISWDAAANADGYRLTIDGSMSDSNDETALVVTGTSHPLANDFINGETVTVTIVPFNADGDATGCVPESFTTISTTAMPPSCTNLVAPVNGTTDVAMDLALISWEAVANADGYRLTIDGSLSDGNDENALVVNGTSHPISNDFTNGETVSVTIVPFNADGDAIGCTTESFTIISAMPLLPSCTTLLNPVNDATDVAVDSSIEWNPAEDAEGYRIAIGTTAGGAELFEGDLAFLTSYTPENAFEYETTIYVTITPYNTEGTALGCNSESFTTLSLPEEPPAEPDTEMLFGFSPDGDGINEYWEINGIENYPENVVSIFNRWGDLVFKIQGYDNSGNVFTGEANQMTSMGAGTLPEGTYFFQIQLPENHNLQTNQGYLVLKR
ncbi:MAG: gliding motility-associated C-terminal domain-containing protein [Bacteroidota bacterium]